MMNEDKSFNHRPFDIQWLDSCYQQTLLPDSPWQKVKFSVDFHCFSPSHHRVDSR